MKNLIALIIILCIAGYGYSQDNVDKQVTDLSAKVNSMQKDMHDMKAANDTMQKSVKNIVCHGTSIPFLSVEMLMVFLPIILFILSIWFIHRGVLGKGFSLKEGLTENSLSTKKIPNPLLDPANNTELNQLLANPIVAAKIDLSPTVEVSDNSYAPSTSRYAALISVFFGLVITACFVSYYIYSYFTCPDSPVDLGKLKDVLLALIVGIAPYGLNKLSAGIQSKQ